MTQNLATRQVPPLSLIGDTTSKDSRSFFSKRKIANYDLEKIVEKTGIPLTLIRGNILVVDRNVELAKIFYAWLLENKVGLSRKEITRFIQEDINKIHYYIDKHYEFLEKGGDIASKYIEMCFKCKSLYNESDFVVKNSQHNIFTINLNVTIRPLDGTLENENFVTQFIIDSIEKNLDIEKGVLVSKSKSRKRKLVYGRYVFFRTVRDFFPKMILSKIGFYMGGKDHSTVLSGLRNHNFLVETKNKEYLSLYIPILKKCSTYSSLGSSGFTRTISGIASYLSQVNIPEEKIKIVEDELINVLKNQFIFSEEELSSILARFGISRI